MDIDRRIERRRTRDGGTPRLVREYDPLSPARHVDDPIGRGAVLERLLDHLDPVFDGERPPNGYLHGPAGSGKSAVVTALFERLGLVATGAGRAVHTSTRARTTGSPAFVYVDARRATSEFSFYRTVLDALVEEPVPEHGIGTGTLRTRLGDTLDGAPGGVVVAVDHVGEPGTPPEADLVGLFAGLPSGVSWLAVGRSPPDGTELAEHTAGAIAVDRYRRQTLVDVLTARGSAALASGALDHAHASRIAEWADGNAHDALAALFVAVERANAAGRTRIADGDVTAALGEVPVPCVPLGAVLALPANRRAVLRALVDLDGDDRSSVTATAEAVGATPGVDLSPGTVRRIVYELAEAGVVERVRAVGDGRRGRPPSRVEPRFPPTVFRRLHDAAERAG